MIDRIIENWLLNANEKNYQSAFCQILGLKGYSVIYLSSHGVAENGKDIIANNKEGEIHVFQLKTGKINVREWRKIYGEIRDLIEIPIQHPNVKSTKKYKAFLVTNGNITSDVRLKIDLLNKRWKQRKLPQLEILSQRELLQYFVEEKGSFLPNTPKEMKIFLELYTGNGKENIKEEKIADLVQSIIYNSPDKISKKEAGRRIASALLMTKYSLFAFEQESNYLSMIKGWIIFCSYMFSLIEKNALSPRYWRISYNLFWHEVMEALRCFKNEILERNNNFLEGDFRGDGGIVYKTRVAVVLGWITAYELILKMHDKKYELDQNIYALIKQNIFSKTFFWGESATIYYLTIARFLDSYGDKKLSMKVYENIVFYISISNNRGTKLALADPYYSAEDILNSIYDSKRIDIDFSNFIGRTYTLKSVINWLVRREKKEILKKFWEPISRLCYSKFIPKPLWRTYFWRSEKGYLKDFYFDIPQSWKKLKRNTFRKPQNIPKMLCEKKDFLQLFLLTYTHRVKDDLVKLTDPNYLNRKKYTSKKKKKVKRK